MDDFIMVQFVHGFRRFFEASGFSRIFNNFSRKVAKVAKVIKTRNKKTLDQASVFEGESTTSNGASGRGPLQPAAHVHSLKE